MAFLKRELIFMILQFLKEENLLETAHVLERESGCFFDMSYFESLFLDGEFDEAENYLSGFTNVHENIHSLRIFFEIKKQKFLEALDKKDRTKALEILMKEFPDFAPYSDRVYGDASLLLSLDNFRNYGALCKYGEVKVERRLIIHALKRCIEENPVFTCKMQPPISRHSGLMNLFMNGSDSAGTSSNNDVALPIPRNMNY